MPSSNQTNSSQCPTGARKLWYEAFPRPSHAFLTGHSDPFSALRPNDTLRYPNPRQILEAGKDLGVLVVELHPSGQIPAFCIDREGRG